MNSVQREVFWLITMLFSFILFVVFHVDKTLCAIWGLLCLLQAVLLLVCIYLNWVKKKVDELDSYED